MKHKSIVLKAAAAAVVLLGAAMSAQAATATANVGVQLNALAAGTCSVNPAAASFDLPRANIGDTNAAWITANFPTASVMTTYTSFKTNAALNQTFNLMCGSTTSITSLTILPAASFNPNVANPAYAYLKDSAGLPAFKVTLATSGMIVATEMLSINGAATPFAFSQSVGTAALTYSTPFSVGQTAVPVVWRPVFSNGGGIGGVGPLVAPTDQTGYKADFVITINY